MIRHRGERYQREGRVIIVDSTADSVVARVDGTHPYRVTLDLAEAFYSCECPYAQGGELCKHVWAVAIQADRERRKALNGGHQPGEDALHAGAPADRSAEPEEARDAEDGGYWDGYDARVEQQQRWRRLVKAPPHPALPLQGANKGETWYLIELRTHGSSLYDWRDKALILHAARRSHLRSGNLGKPTRVGSAPGGGKPQGIEGLVWALARSGTAGTVALGWDLAQEVLPTLCEAGRLGAVHDLHASQVTPLRWDAQTPWRLRLKAQKRAKGAVSVTGVLFREAATGSEELPVEKVESTLKLNLVLVGDQLMSVVSEHAPWIEELTEGPLRLSAAEFKKFKQALAANLAAPRLEGETSSDRAVVVEPPQPRLRLTLPRKSAKLIKGTLVFAYGEHEVGVETGDTDQTPATALVPRDLMAETEAINKLQELGVLVELDAPQAGVRPFAVKLESSDFIVISPDLIRAGFRLEVEGKPYRRAAGWQPIIESGQDWFELKAKVDFDGELLSLPELLKAVRKKEHWVKLRDGSFGLLPDEWLESLDTLAQLVPAGSDELRFHPSQAYLVEGCLRGAAELETDDGFEAMKASFDAFRKIVPKRTPRDFKGALRGYQRTALGWVAALDELGFGGCLADDMGLGKTVVVLAWLLVRAQQKRKLAKGAQEHWQPKPSLLVVPKSLLFNWQRECERFTPSLRLLLHHGPERELSQELFTDFDIVLTSYGTLRKDVEFLAQTDFDYVVLDEAHSIKNASTEAHRAASALNSRRRLALTGTPVENHLGELWNLLSFLNPGVLRGLGHLKKALEGRRVNAGQLERSVLAFIQPFILRRTKAQVAKELPERIEKTLYVQLSNKERELYDDLAAFYRRRLWENKAINKRLKQPAKSGAGRQMAQALEGLLRLRQAACHPGLLDKDHAEQSSAKFDVLLGELEALRDEGHKALVFSQFTQLLKLLEPHLKSAGIGYCYLDGKTRNREAEVERFQTDQERSAFLISLKAGGVGLNLVAADYVFLLDPWWNPASEAQAIDRAHRIGQTRKVIAYRILAQNTVEEKVAALQQEKRDLAEALFGDTANFSAKFTRDDLEKLLGG